MEFDILPGEAFYGGAVMDGINQPYTQASERELDLTRNQTPNQMMPLLLSTAGRWVWNPDGMRISFRKGRIQCTDGTILGQSTGVASSISRCDGTLLSLTRDPAR